MKSSHMLFVPRHSDKFQKITRSDKIRPPEHKLEISQLLVKVLILMYDQLEKWRLGFNKSNCLWLAKSSTLKYAIENVGITCKPLVWVLCSKIRLVAHFSLKRKTRQQNLGKKNSIPIKLFKDLTCYVFLKLPSTSEWIQLYAKMGQCKVYYAEDQLWLYYARNWHAECAGLQAAAG